MAVEDFAEPERAAVAELLVKAARYASQVPPPSSRVQEQASPRINVQVNPDGSLAVEKAGAVLGTVGSAAALSTLLPRCIDDDPVSIAASYGVDYSAIIAVMDELRSLGCGHISFAARR
jgi:biopolymer transport protein ExbD